MPTNVVYLHNLPEKMRDIIKSDIGQVNINNVSLKGNITVAYPLKPLTRPLPKDLVDELKELDIHLGIRFISIIRKRDSFKVVE